MEKYSTSVQPNQGARAQKHSKPKLHDHVERETEHGMIRKHPHHHHEHAGRHYRSHPRHQQEARSSEDQDSHGTQSTAESDVHHHQHHREKYQQHFHAPDVTSHSRIANSSSGSSSFSSSSSSTLSSSSWSSESSVESTGLKDTRRRRYSQSCTDVSKWRRAFDEEEDNATPLLDDEGRLFKHSTKEEAKEELSSHQPSAKGVLRKKEGVTKGVVARAGSVRKAKSMEALSRRDGRREDDDAALDEEELESRKEEARENLVAAKVRFSAFLNEITRQVLSPSRLSSLGVTDAHGPSSPAKVSPKSPKVEHKAVDKTRQQSSHAGSTDSMASSIQSNTSKSSRSNKHSHSSKLSHTHHGKRHHHHSLPLSARGTPQRRHHFPDGHIDISTSPDKSPSHHHHGRPHSSGHRYRDHYSPTHHHHHGDHLSQTHHHGDHQSPTHHHHHGDHHSPTHHHHHRDRHSQTHDHGDHHSQTHHHGDHHSPTHHHGDHYSQTHHHGDHHSPTHHHHHGDHHSPTHHYGDHHSPTHHHHNGDHHSPTSHHPHRDHHSQNPHHHHGDHHSQTYYHVDHHGSTHHRGDTQSPTQQHGLDSHNESHDLLPHAAHPKSHHDDTAPPAPPPRHASTEAPHHPPSEQSHHHPTLPSHGETHHFHHHHDDHHSPSLCHEGPSPVWVSRELESRPVKSGSPSPTAQDGQQTSYTGSALLEKAPERDSIIKLQEQNEELHHSLLQTTVRMESMGAEFKSSHQLLQSELQGTHKELRSLLDKFKRLQDNYSSTQQTNDLLERKLHSVAQNMDGERERLNQRISALTEQLAKANTTIHCMETINVTSVLQEAHENHLRSAHSINQCLLPVAPPPAQFMDGYGKIKLTAEDQSLGAVLEEGESDWSETGDETPRFVLVGGPGGGHRGNTAFLPWRRGVQWAGQGEGDTESESGGEEGGYRVTAARRLGPPIRVLSASLDEIPRGWGLQRHGRPRGTEAALVLRRSDDGATEASEGGLPVGREPEPAAESGLAGRQSARGTVGHFICQLRPGQGGGRGLRVEERGWVGGVPEEVLNGERTQL